MHLVDNLPQTGGDLAAYREAIVQAYNISDVRRLCIYINKDIPHDIDFTGSPRDVVDGVLHRAAQVGWLRQLLVLALRHRASNREFVNLLAPRLGVTTLVALSDQVSGTCSPKEL